MGQIKNIKLHIVTDIKLYNTLYNKKQKQNGGHSSSSLSPSHHAQTTKEHRARASSSCHRRPEEEEGSESETWCHLQTRHGTRQRIPCQGTRRNSPPTHGQTRRKLLRSS